MDSRPPTASPARAGIGALSTSEKKLRSPGRYRWRDGMILSGAVVSVLAAWACVQIQPDSNLATDWILDWGVGAFYAAAVLVPLGWYRSGSFTRVLLSLGSSVVAWHWAVRLAAESYSPPEGNLVFIARSTVAGFLGAVLTGAPLLAGRRRPRWERRLTVSGAVGAICGAYMAALCLWNFEIGFWLGMVGWQLAVTATYLLATAPPSAGRSSVWPDPTAQG